MLNKISIYLSENPTLRYWIIRPEWVAVILLILSIIASLQLSPFFADLAFIMDSATPYVEYGLIAMRHLNENGNRLCTANEIADIYHIPKEIMAKTMQKLWQRREEHVYSYISI